MKKRDYKKLALLGLTGSLLLTGTGCESMADRASNSEEVADATMSEQDLLSQLSPEGRQLYNSLNDQGKKLALQLASQTCKGKNSCKGLNSCKTDSNSCQGLGGCKGTSPGPFKNKNSAVKVAAMATKRQNM